MDQPIPTSLARWQSGGRNIVLDAKIIAASRRQAERYRDRHRDRALGRSYQRRLEVLPFAKGVAQLPS
jgi:hypothetical protein